jgi:hypothetical protein
VLTASHVVLSGPDLPSQLNAQKALDTLEELLCVAAFSHCAQFAVISFSGLRPCIVFTASTASDSREASYLSELFKHSHDIAFANHFDPSKRQLLLSLAPRPDNAHISFWESVALEDDDGTALGHLHIMDLCRIEPLDSQESNICGSMANESPASFAWPGLRQPKYVACSSSLEPTFIGTCSN